MMDIQTVVQDALTRDEHLMLEAPSSSQRAIHLYQAVAREAADRGESAVVAVGNQAALHHLAACASSEDPSQLPQLRALDDFMCPARWAREEAWLIEASKACDQGTSPSVDPEHIESLQACAATSSLRADLAEVVPQALWQRISTSAHECLGSTCPFAQNCPGLKNLQKAEPGVRLTTHGALFQWLQFQRRDPATFSDVKVSMLVLDDADQALDAAASALGFEIPLTSVLALTRPLSAIHAPSTLRLLMSCTVVMQAYTDERIRLPTTITPSLTHPLVSILEQAAVRFRRQSNTLQDQSDATWVSWELDARRALQFAGGLHDAMKRDAPGTYTQAEATPDGTAVVGRRPDPRQWLAWQLFGMPRRRFRSVIVAGPALTIDGNEDWLKQSLGVPDQVAFRKIPVPPTALKRLRLVALRREDFPAAASVSTAIGLERTLAEVQEPIHATFNSLRTQDFVKKPSRAYTCVSGPDCHGPLSLTAILRGTSCSRTRGPAAIEPHWRCHFVEGLLINGTDLCLDLGSDDDILQVFMRAILPRAVLKFRRQLDHLLSQPGARRALVINDSRLLERGYSGLFLQGLDAMSRVRDLSGLRQWLTEEPEHFGGRTA